MKKTERIGMVRRVVDDIERRKAEALAACEKSVRAAQAKLDELEAYRAAYVRDFTRRAEAGMNGAGAREYQVFLSRLDEALRQQAQLLAQARLQRSAELEVGATQPGERRRSATSQPIGRPRSGLPPIKSSRRKVTSGHSNSGHAGLPHMAADLMQLAVPGGGPGSDALSGRSSVRNSPAPTSSVARSSASPPSPAASSTQESSAAPRSKQPATDPPLPRRAPAPPAGWVPCQSFGQGPLGDVRRFEQPSAPGGQTARSATKGCGASGTSAAGAAQAATQGAAAATDFSAALAQSLAATPTDGAAPTDTPAGKATANSAAEGSSEPPAKHSVADAASNALTLLEQALAGALPP